MAEPWLRQHALAHRALDARPAAALDPAAGVRMWLEPPCGQFCLRGDPSGAFASAIESVLGVAPPGVANTVASHGTRRILWLGPDEWLVVCAEHETADVLLQLEQAVEGEHALVSDVSHSRVIVALAGPHARDVLLKGTSLDLDPVGFKAGQCAQSALARAHMLLHQVDDAPVYHVYVHRSFADYAFSWLEDAAAEYAVVAGAGARPGR